VKRDEMKWPTEQLGQPPEYYLDWWRIHSEEDVDAWQVLAAGDRLVEQLIWRLSKMRDVKMAWMMRANDFQLRISNLENDLDGLRKAIEQFTEAKS